jgi:hypothetical protein
MPDAVTNTAVAGGDIPLSRRWSGGVLREIYRVHNGERLLKRYWIGSGVKRYDRPWRHEHHALARLAGRMFANTFGYTEQPREHGKEVVFTREFIEGSAIDVCDENDIRDFAAMLAVLHQRGVVTGDIQLKHIIRRPDGQMSFIDFGRAVVYHHPSPRFYYRVGGELAEALQVLCRGDRAASQIFRAAYIARAAPRAWQLTIMMIGFRAARTLRRLRASSRPGRLRREGGRHPKKDMGA